MDFRLIMNFLSPFHQLTPSQAHMLLRSHALPIHQALMLTNSPTHHCHTSEVEVLPITQSPLHPFRPKGVRLDHTHHSHLLTFSRSQAQYVTSSPFLHQCP